MGGRWGCGDGGAGEERVSGKPLPSPQRQLARLSPRGGVSGFLHPSPRRCTLVLQLITVSRSLKLPPLSFPSKADGSKDMHYIALAMGAAGITSRVMNRYFTPVSHPCMNTKAAPGQIPAHDILEARRIINVHQVPRRFFYVPGNFDIILGPFLIKKSPFLTYFTFLAPCHPNTRRLRAQACARA